MDHGRPSFDVLINLFPFALLFLVSIKSNRPGSPDHAPVFSFVNEIPPNFRINARLRCTRHFVPRIRLSTLKTRKK